MFNQKGIEICCFFTAISSSPFIRQIMGKIEIWMPGTQGKKGARNFRGPGRAGDPATVGFAFLYMGVYRASNRSILRRFQLFVIQTSSNICCGSLTMAGSVSSPSVKGSRVANFEFNVQQIGQFQHCAMNVAECGVGVDSACDLPSGQDLRMLFA